MAANTLAEALAAIRDKASARGREVYDKLVKQLT